MKNKTKRGCLPVVKENYNFIIQTNKHTHTHSCLGGGAEEIKSTHPTVNLTSHPTEHTGGVLLCPQPAEINEIAA